MLSGAPAQNSRKTLERIQIIDKVKARERRSWERNGFGGIDGGTL